MKTRRSYSKLPLFRASVTVLFATALWQMAKGADLLRAHFNSSSSNGGVSASYGATAATTAQGQTKANDVLSRTTQALQAAQAMQAAARNLAQSQANNAGLDPNHPGVQLPNVPNGLVTGGLVPDSGLASQGVANPVSTWQNAKTPTQAVNNGQTTVNITQTAQQALLNWQTFNIGRNTALNIDQSAGGTNVNEWIAFNIVNDPSGIPSQILGSMKALGQIYLINQNGIIFGGNSQVNVHALVASSLPINTGLVSRGLLNNPDNEFLFSQLSITGSNGGSGFTPPAPLTPSGRDGDVTVQQGAQIAASDSSDHVGGRVALIGPNVTNAGSISTPDGQTILAAGNQVAFAAHNSSDPSLRGLDTYVGSVDSFSGNATNSGVIDAPRADVTMVGADVNQLGSIHSTTSVSLNGRIDLDADFNAITSGGIAKATKPYFPQSTGVVTLGPGSVTEIVPELSSQDRVVGSALALSSEINMDGLAIHMASQSTIFAPSADVTLNAGVWKYLPAANNPDEAFVFSSGQVYLDSGATIEVAGSEDVSASVTENIVAAQLRGTELANSPLQRDGALRGQTVNVDILQTGVFNGASWVGSPIGNLSGYANLVQHTVGELTIAGGSVSLNAGGSIVTQAGSLIDVSGGWINYTGAMVQTTKVVSGGHIYDISQATPNIVYDGVIGGFTTDHAKWGVSESFSTLLVGGPYFEAGFTQGGNGGSVTITAPSMALDGNLLGNTVAGPRQRTPASEPNSSALVLLFQQQDFSTQHFFSPLPPNVVIESGVTQAAADQFALDISGNPLALRADREAKVVLSPDLVNDDGFGTLVINNGDGNITVPSGVSLSVPAGRSSLERNADGSLALDSNKNTIQLPGGAITLVGANIDIEGSISAPDGSLTFNVYDFTPLSLTTVLSTPPVDPTRGNFTLGSAASLSTAGLLVNDLPGSPTAQALPLITAGGTVAINTFNATLKQGSSIDVSGGAYISSSGKQTYGNGGSIAITAGQDPGITSLIGGKLSLGASLKGYSGAAGGTLRISAPLVQVGGVAGNPGTLLLSPDFFSQGGFNNFSINGFGGVALGSFVPGMIIAPGTVISPVVQSLQLMPDGSGDLTFQTITKPAGVRSPVNLTLGSSGVRDNTQTASVKVPVVGEVVMGEGAVINTDPKGSVTLKGDTVAVLGNILAPGGAITISGQASSALAFGIGVPTVDIGPNSLLSTAGTLLLTPDPSGNNYRTGSVLPGGTISISGNIVAEAGSVLDVSGATGMLDLPAAQSGRTTPLNGSLNGQLVIPTEQDSNGGSITLAGAEELFTDAALRGAAGGPSAVGGSLTVAGVTLPASNATPLNVTLTVTQGGPVIPAPFYPAGQTAIGNTVVDGMGHAIDPHGYIAVDSFNSGGFDSLNLQGTVQFSGPVSISVPGTLKVGSAGVIFADSAVKLDAHYVDLGQAFLLPLSIVQANTPPFQAGGGQFSAPPSYGTGSLTITADSLIDVGNLTLQNIGNVNLTASNGDVRGDGTLDVAGSLKITAGQIYPATEDIFTINVYDKNIVVASSAAGNNIVTLASPVLPPGFGVGSPLLGSTVQSINGTTVTLVSGANATISKNTSEALVPGSGSITIARGASRDLPLSAGGILNIYASNIQQGGVLRAPIGAINLGWDGDTSGGATAPVDPITGQALASTQQVTLSAGSITSVSAVDPATGQGITIPFGTVLNGIQWIDPRGTDITASGVPAKAVNISGQNVSDQKGAVIDLSGGGDLYAYRFVSGTGGSSDILASTTSYAIIPGYRADYAPVDPVFNPNNNLAVGRQIYLQAGNGLAAGVYTLLPARYALLPGAYLVTPQGGNVVPTPVSNPDGSSVTPGYLLSAGQTGQPLYTSFEVDPQSVVLARAEYDSFSANTFLKEGALKNNSAVPRLPVDAGQLVLAATQSMAVQGSVKSQSSGLGGLVDISSPVDIVIVGSAQAGSVPAGDLALDSTTLGNFGAASLLIGGVRQTGTGGATVTVTTNNITVNNSGSPLTGADVILAANDSITLDAGAVVESSGASSNTAQTLLFGNSATAGSGDGVLLRVSNDPAAQIIRSGVASQAAQAALPAGSRPTITINAGALVSGGAAIVDSTYATSLDPAASITGGAITLDSGQITLELTNPGSILPTAGLVLAGNALQALQSAHSLSLLSYSSIDIYGTGQVGSSAFASLSLHAAELRGFNNGGGAVSFAAQNILLDNSAAGTAPGPVAPAAGTLSFDGGVITLGNNTVAIDQYSDVKLNATGGIMATGTGGVAVPGTLEISTPLITGAKGSSETFSAVGALTMSAPAGGSSVLTSGLAVSLVFQGSSVTDNTNIAAPSGSITLHATNGDVVVGNLAQSRLDVAGTAQVFFDLVKYTSGGSVTLASDTGNVNLGADATVTVAAQPGGGNAGALTIGAPQGSFSLLGTLLGQGGAGGRNGTFTLDAGTIAGGDLATINSILSNGGFTESVTIQDRNDALITMDGVATAHSFNLSTDTGSITVIGAVNASGATGGKISMQAHGSLTLLSGASLTVAGQNFDDAGKGGLVSLEAGSETGGSFTNITLGTGPQLDIQAGSTIDLSVAANTDPAANAALGRFNGTLHLRAPQALGNTDLQVQPINGAILNASKIVIEGYQVYTPGGGSIDSMESSILSNGNTFVGAAGTTTASYTTMLNRLFANNTALEPLVYIEPGAEIVNPSGDLTLAKNWDLSTYRFGPNSAAGDLTLRAAGNLIFIGSGTAASLSDGFASGAVHPSTTALWQAPLMPVGSQSWSYRLVSGADFAGAAYQDVAPLSSLAANKGSLLLGKGATALPTTSQTLRSVLLATRYQTIRTGNGDIDIFAGRDVQLLNSLATIYTAGSQATAMANFDLPNTAYSSSGVLGSAQSPFYPVQYSLGGGNVTVAAQQDIAHYIVTASGTGQDSSKEMPTNWLYRRGWVDPATGQFAAPLGNDVESTTWWIDFSNFVEGVGALGGGNVTMTAGRNITNVDAVVPTNARMPKGTPDAAALQELGGGDLTVRAGNNINGGVYYVERGQGALSAGNQILTNSTRAALASGNTLVNDPATWLPTTLFLGQGSFDVSAAGNVLLGPVANPFLLPQGINNNPQEKTYFSTYASTDSVDVSSLTGSVTLKDSSDGGDGSLFNWYTNVLSFTKANSYSKSQPWLKLTESSVLPFSTVMALMPPTLHVTAFSGDINTVGRLTLSPSPVGTVDLVAAGSINGVQINGAGSAWGSSVINLSDANPDSIPGITAPLSLKASSLSSPTTDSSFLNGINLLFNESGATNGIFGVIQTKQALHDSTLLHAGDNNPLRLYAGTGNISGITLYSSKLTDVIAGNDITDVALYIQNDNADNVSVVVAGRDVILYDPNSPLRILAQAPGNMLVSSGVGSDTAPGTGTPTAGDIQINGPGTLEVLAGRNLDTGVGPNNASLNTAVGITSIGNARNPFLPFEGADIILGAGIGPSFGLDSGSLDFTSFISTFLDPNGSGSYSTRYLPDLAKAMGLDGTSNDDVWNDFEKLSSQQQDILALDMFYLVLRDAGRDHNDKSSPGFGNYDAGEKAISTLFPDAGGGGVAGQGDITLTSREIKTSNGGDISLFTPVGQVTVGLQINGAQAADQGILTTDGGNINIFTDGNVNVGVSRIFTLRGGNEIIWSTTGNIAAGASSKTVQSAPPTRVLIDPQSGDVQTDLAGLSTGGGIGVLASVSGVTPGDVDLIAPKGTVDAGDAGIRATGNLNIAAVTVLNASNIAVGGNSNGTPPPPAAPNVAGLASAGNSTAATNNAANDVSRQQTADQSAGQQDIPSIITVEVLGYGGGDDQTSTEDDRKKSGNTPGNASNAQAGDIVPLASRE